MIFKMFSKPKWQHRDADVRKQAVSALRPEDVADVGVLTQLAQADPDAEVRTLAVKRLTDLAVLYALMSASDSPAPAIEAASQRWLKFVVQGVAPRDLEARLQQLDALKDSKMLEHIARHAEAVAMRLAALRRIEKESVATDLSINDAATEVRSAALAKVTQISALERIIKATRTKDKHIYHAAKAKLEAAIEVAERPKRIQEHAGKLIAQIEQIPNNGDLDFQVARYAELLTAWHAMAAEVAAETLAHCQSAQQKTGAHLDAQQQRREVQRAAEAEWIPARAARQKILDEIARLQEDLRNRITADENIEHTITTALDELATQWRNQSALPDEEARQCEGSYTRALRAARDELQSLKQNAQFGVDVQRLMDQAAGLARAKTLDLEAFRRLQRVVSKRRDIPTRFAALWSDLGRAMQQLDERATQVEAQQKQAQKAFEQHLKTLQKALEEGHLDDATQAHREAQKTLRIAQEVSAAAHRLWNELEDKFVKLRDWRNWANTPQKERLVAQMEALTGSTDDPVEIGNLVRAAREEWQRLGGGAIDAETSEALWQRFNSACDAAYAPAKKYFEAQAQQRVHSAGAREEFLVKLEVFIRDADWTTVDWNKVERLSREARVEWRALGITDRKIRKVLDERFDAAINALKEKLAAEWARNIQQKEALIARITALLANVDDQAIRTAKQASAQWKAIGPAGHRKEQALWKAFRAACDGVFNRQRELSDQARAAREQQRVQKIALLEKIEQLNALAPEALLAAHNDHKELQTQWATLAGDDKTDIDLQKRVESAVHAHQEARTAARAAIENMREQHFVQKAALCAELEAALESSAVDSAQLDTWKARWQAIGDASDEDAVYARFEKIIQAAQDPALAATWRQALAEQLQQRLLMALQLEILADVESPAAYRDARMQYQVERMKKSFGQAAVTDKQAEYRRLARVWYTHGAIPAQQVADLEARMACVRDQMQRHVRHHGPPHKTRASAHAET